MTSWVSGWGGFKWSNSKSPEGGVGRFTDDKLGTDVVISDELASKLRCAAEDGSLWPAAGNRGEDQGRVRRCMHLPCLPPSSPRRETSNGFGYISTEGWFTHAVEAIHVQYRGVNSRAGLRDSPRAPLGGLWRLPRSRRLWFTQFFNRLTPKGQVCALFDYPEA